MKAVLDHVGIAISDLQASLAFFRDVLGLHVETSEEIASRNARHFLSTGQSTLKVEDGAGFADCEVPGETRTRDAPRGAARRRHRRDPGTFEEPRHPPDR